MKITHYPEDDVIYIDLQDKPNVESEVSANHKSFRFWLFF